MFCKKCGTQNDDNAVKCTKCGESLKAVVQAKTPNYLVQAILVTVFCCLPLGIVAIIFAAQVNTKIGAGDIEGAKKSSKNAKMWSWIAFGLGLVGLVIYVVIVAGSMASLMKSGTPGLPIK